MITVALAVTGGPPHRPPGDTCQQCQSAPSEPVAKASRRPSAFFDTEGEEFITTLGGVPREAQLPQPFPGTVCQICQSAPSWPLTRVSRCPSSFLSTVGGDILLASSGKPREAQLLQVPFGVVCQICQSAPSEPTVKTS